MKTVTKLAILSITAVLGAASVAVFEHKPIIQIIIFMLICSYGWIEISLIKRKKKNPKNPKNVKTSYRRINDNIRDKAARRKGGYLGTCRDVHGDVQRGLLSYRDI